MNTPQINEMTQAEYEQAIDDLAARLANDAASCGNAPLALSGLLTAYFAIADKYSTADGLQECAGIVMHLAMRLAATAAERRRLPAGAPAPGQIH